MNNDAQEKEQIEKLRDIFSLKIHEAFDNPGFGTSANRGAQQASGDILFFINPDTEWRESFFSEVQQKFLQNNNTGAVGIQMISPQGIPESTNVEKEFLFQDMGGSFFSKERLVWLSGGALFVPKDVFRKVGGFDERFFMYFEDMDLCVRIQKSGYKLVFHTAQKITHFRGRSHCTKKSQKRLYDQSLYQYTKKNWTPAQHRIFSVFHLVYRFLFPYGRS